MAAVQRRVVAAVAMDVLSVHKFLFNPHFNLESDFIIRKKIRHRIQRCNLRREILSTFHTRVDRRSVRHVAIQINGSEISKNAENHARNKQPLPLEARGLPSNT